MKKFLTKFNALRLGITLSVIAIIFFATCALNFTNAGPGTPIEISALDLHKAFMANPVILCFPSLHRSQIFRDL
jgi:hypothetical protein